MSKQALSRKEEFENYQQLCLIILYIRSHLNQSIYDIVFAWRCHNNEKNKTESWSHRKNRD